MCEPLPNSAPQCNLEILNKTCKFKVIVLFLKTFNSTIMRMKSSVRVEENSTLLVLSADIVKFAQQLDQIQHMKFEMRLPMSQNLQRISFNMQLRILFSQ